MPQTDEGSELNHSLDMFLTVFDTGEIITA